MLITGCSPGGLGVEVARALHLTGEISNVALTLMRILQKLMPHSSELANVPWITVACSRLAHPAVHAAPNEFLYTLWCRRSCVHHRQRSAERANCTEGHRGQLQIQSGQSRPVAAGPKLTRVSKRLRCRLSQQEQDLECVDQQCRFVNLLLLMLMHSQASTDCSSKGCLQSFGQLHLAGVMACPEGQTKEGFETQFGTSHVAHFLLFQLLKPALLASSTPEFNSRLVSVSSSGHEYSGILFDDLNLKKAGYDMWKAYGQSKTANIYLANEVRDSYILSSSALVASPVVKPCFALR